jgi:hypothetical protein
MMMYVCCQYFGVAKKHIVSMQPASKKTTMKLFASLRRRRRARVFPPLEVLLYMNLYRTCMFVCETYAHTWFNRNCKYNVTAPIQYNNNENGTSAAMAKTGTSKGLACRNTVDTERGIPQENALSLTCKYVKTAIPMPP